VLPAVVRFAKDGELPVYSEWSVNEKVAAEAAIAACWAGTRAACVMKQVGLNVASDPVMSAAYIGVRAGLVLVVADDPGPHSSQTEQDTRLFGLFAKIPVFDPSSPDEARRMVAQAYAVSEQHEIPVILRLTTRISHGREGMPVKLPPPPPSAPEPPPSDSGRPRRKVERILPHNPSRWAATPRHRYKLHVELAAKLRAIAAQSAASPFNERSGPPTAPLGIVAGGHAYAVVSDLLALLGVADRVPLLKIGTPFPLPVGLVTELQAQCEQVLVLEDCDATIELQLPDRTHVRGRMDGTVPAAGELDPAIVQAALEPLLAHAGLTIRRPAPVAAGLLDQIESPPLRAPTLCPGCGHRTVFFSLRRGFPRNTIFTGDIGCYTLGISLGSVDTVLAMGASIGMASGFYRALALAGREDPVVATIGDSTFLHAGVAGLLNAVYVRSRFVLFILDNAITAMTGGQPTAAIGVLADGSMGQQVSIRKLVEACGVGFVEEVHAKDVRAVRDVAKRALEHTRRPDGGPAVVIAQYPCVVAQRGMPADEQVRVDINERCNGCGVCVTAFQCPSLSIDPDLGVAVIDRMLCIDCGDCIQSCGRKAIVPTPAPAADPSEDSP
jgi:indolepyruvate ferredoxin oxidoreductase alpha subunit